MALRSAGYWRQLDDQNDECDGPAAAAPTDGEGLTYELDRGGFDNGF